MIKLNKVKVSRAKRVGRGYGSGKGGHTVGRGQKGQKARRTIKILFEGLKMKKSLIKRLPFRRGKDKFKARFNKPIAINLHTLSLMPSGVVDIDSLVKAGLVDMRDAHKYGVKILGNGVIKNKLVVKLPISAPAAKKIKSAGGEVLSL